jgi:hypothetical protein
MPCHHTLHTIDENEKPTGSWAIRTSTKKGQKPRKKVVCSVCGRFYGYVADEGRNVKSAPKTEPKSARKATSR